MINKYAANKNVQVLLAVLLFALLTGLLSNLLPPAVDFHGAFRPAALELLHGRSPYNAEGFFNPPWTAILLIPFAILPENAGRAVMVIAALAAYAYVAHKLGANKLTVGLLLLSPPSMHGILNGNIDWLAVLGVVLPPWLGLFFLAIKPQVGMIVILYLFFAEWRKGGPLRVLKTFLPVGLASALSIAIFGPWFTKISNEINLAGNSSLWPQSLPIGLILLTAAIRKNEIRYAMAASPFVSPYVIMHSWIGAFLALAPQPWEAAAAVIGMWIVVLLQYFA
ncbi:MAG: hypothetical protein Kow0070_03710 [Anaerolineales bacterium]